jgi:hypothetical protein
MASARGRRQGLAPAAEPLRQRERMDSDEFVRRLQADVVDGYDEELEL